ncbi:MAG TPA: twin-arginine translocase TatA/TatE family subunit [Parafilimonas sp.]|jgi:sec-independent protein translocase protein TatA
MSTPGISEWVLIILAVLILFGGRKIPEFMRGLGKGIREFNDAKNNVRRELEDGINETPRQSANTNNTTTQSTTTTTTQP